MTELDWVLRAAGILVHRNWGHEFNTVRFRSIRNRQSRSYHRLSVLWYRAIWEEAVAHMCVLALGCYKVNVEVAYPCASRGCFFDGFLFLHSRWAVQSKAAELGLKCRSV